MLQPFTNLLNPTNPLDLINRYNSGMFFHSLLVAYIDPSAGGMLVQMLLAGTAGVAVLGKLYWSRIKATLGLKPKPDTIASEDAKPSDHDRV